MRLKMLLSFFAGAVLAAAVFIGLMVFTSSARAEDAITTDNLTSYEPSVQDLANILEQVRSEIQDPETLAFYDKLITKYELVDGESGTATLIPDIEKIQYAALTLPFHEAGKQINDPDIKDFYYRFLRDSGLLDPMPGS